MYAWPVSAGPPRPQGVAVVHIDSPAYQTRLELRKAAPTRGLGERARTAPEVRSSTSPTWFCWAFRTEKAMRAPSGLAIGWIHTVPLLTFITLLAGSHDCTPAGVRK